MTNQRLDLNELGQGGRIVKVQSPQTGEWAEIWLRPVHDMTAILEAARLAQAEAVGSFSKDADAIAGRMALLEADCRTDPEGTAEVALEAQTRKVLPDGRVVNEIEWEAQHKFPPLVLRDAPDPQINETREAWEGDCENRRRQNEGQAAKQADWIAAERARRLSALTAMPAEERAKLLRDDEYRMTGLRAFVHRMDAEILLQCCCRVAEGGGQGAPYFSKVDEVFQLPEWVREQIMGAHRESAEAQPETPFVSPATTASV